MAERPVVVFVDRDPPSGFMAMDRRCLAETAEVRPLLYPGRPTPAFLAACLREIRRADTVYAFFASEHALVPALVARALGRRFVLVPAGYDYADVPEHRYGLAARGLGWLPTLIGRLATVALPISRQTMWEFLEMVPSAAPSTRVAYLAVDPDEWCDPGVERDPRTVVTVGYVDEEAWSRKGVDRFVEAARRDPGRRYVLVGRIAPAVAERIERLAPSNLELTGRLEHDDLRRTLWGAGVYAQLSWHETFGVAMAEAMLCGCVPVITDSPALGEVAGRWAVRTGGRDDDVAAVGRAAERGFTVDRAEMRADVADRFSVKARTADLAAAVAG